MQNCFFISILIPLVSSESLRVLRTTHDMASFSPSSGAELLNSSLHDLNEMTVCARFSTYQFITHGYREPLQVLLSVGEDLEFLSSYTMLPEPSIALGFWESLWAAFLLCKRCYEYHLQIGRSRRHNQDITYIRRGEYKTTIFQHLFVYIFI